MGANSIADAQLKETQLQGSLSYYKVCKDIVRGVIDLTRDFVGELERDSIFGVI
jgi:hypothetical protein